MPDATTTAADAATTATTTTEATKTATPKTEDRSLDNFPPELQAHVRDLRKENEKKTERLKALEAESLTTAQKLKDLEKAEEDRQNAKLTEEKKFQELAEQEKKKREDLERTSAEKLRSRDVAIIRQELRAQARELGIIDQDDIKTIDIRDMRVSDEGEVPGAKEAVEALKAAKAHWFKAADAAGDQNRQRARISAPAQNGAATTTTDASTWDAKTLKARWDSVKL